MRLELGSPTWWEADVKGHCRKRNLKLTIIIMYRNKRIRKDISIWWNDVPMNREKQGRQAR